MDKARLDEVKRRNKILQACKEWENNGIKISINDFYDLHTTLQLQEKIIAKLDELDSQKKYIICKNKEEIEDFLNYTNKVICKSMKYAFFVANATKLGALKLQGNIISNNIEYVISKSEFLNGGCSIFICSCGLKMVYVYGEESMIVEFTFGSSSLFVNKHNEINDQLCQLMCSWSDAL